MVIYWLENVVIGIYNVARMSRATGTVSIYQAKIGRKPYNSSMKGKTIVFFMIHYGLFALVHGTFVGVLFGPADITARAFLIGVGSLAVSHGISYVKNFIGKSEYERISPADLFIHPYTRVVVLHLVILFGALPAKLLGAPVIAVVLLIGLKTAVDLYIHRKEHRRLDSIQIGV